MSAHRSGDRCVGTPRTRYIRLVYQCSSAIPRQTESALGDSTAEQVLAASTNPNVLAQIPTEAYFLS